MISDSDQSKESLYSDSDKDVGNASDIPNYQKNLKLKMSQEMTLQSQVHNIYQVGPKTHQCMVLLKLNLAEIQTSVTKKNLVIIFTEELCETIAKMTNLYAERLIAKNKGNLSSHLNKWKKVTSSEMKLVFGFILHQGMTWKPTYEHYFTTNSIFSTPGVKSFMPYNRFQVIDRFLQFANNEKLGEKHPLAAKIQPVWDYGNERFQSIYTLGNIY